MKKRNVVGEYVRQARKSARPPITQIDLVARLQLLDINIDQSGLSKLENGQRPVTDIEVLALAKALNLPLYRLLKDNSYS